MENCHSQFRALWSYDNASEQYDLENMWFQQDGATYHTIRANMVLLQETFPGGLISCDLTPLEFFCGVT